MDKEREKELVALLQDVVYHETGSPAHERAVDRAWKYLNPNLTVVVKVTE